jgi:uncharacterized protein (DUF1330 family)
MTKGEPMTAYVIADIDVHDKALYQEYAALVAGTLRPHGGRVLVRSASHETLEGDWRPRLVVVLEFPGADDARRWYSSREYAEPMALRRRASTGSLVLVDAG